MHDEITHQYGSEGVNKVVASLSHCVPQIMVMELMTKHCRESFCGTYRIAAAVAGI